MSEMNETAQRTPNVPAVIDAPVQRLPAEYNPLADVGVSKTNLPMDDPDGRRLHDMALNGDHPALADSVNVAIDLYAYVIHPYQGVDRETGELFVRNRLVIVTHEGNFYQSGGYYTEESLGRLIRSNGPGPWHPPIKVQVLSFPNSHGGRIYKLCPPAGESKRMPWMAQPKKGGKDAK